MLRDSSFLCQFVNLLPTTRDLLLKTSLAGNFVNAFCYR